MQEKIETNNSIQVICKILLLKRTQICIHVYSFSYFFIFQRIKIQFLCLPLCLHRMQAFPLMLTAFEGFDKSFIGNTFLAYIRPNRQKYMICSNILSRNSLAFYELLCFHISWEDRKRKKRKNLFQSPKD